MSRPHWTLRRRREKVWVLRHLGRAGFTQDELATVYKTVIRPTIDYCAVIYHPMMTNEQDPGAEVDIRLWHFICEDAGNGWSNDS